MEKTSKYPHRQRKLEIRRLTIEQIKQLLDAMQEHPLKALLTVAITTGLRRQELLSLHWEAIDAQNEILHVRGMAFRVGDRASTETVRTIALPTIAMQVLKEHRQNQEEARIKSGETWHNLDLVFPNEAMQKWDALFSELPFESHSHTIRHILLHKPETEEE